MAPDQVRLLLWSIENTFMHRSRGTPSKEDGRSRSTRKASPVPRESRRESRRDSKSISDRPRDSRRQSTRSRSGSGGVSGSMTDLFMYDIPSANFKFHTCIRSLILTALQERGFEETDEEHWDFMWAGTEWMRESFDYTRLVRLRRVNHYKRSFELTRKDLLAKNLKKYRRMLRKQGSPLFDAVDFFPSTYTLPSDYSMFYEEFKRRSGQVWIMKPVGRAQGKGIFLFTNIRQIDHWRRTVKPDDEEKKVEMYVVQEYLSNPYLIGGKKFDLRLYVLVTSYRPLTCYIYREGFARFSFTPFSMDDIHDTYVHLTNVSLQKYAPNYDAGAGAKWDLHSLRRYLQGVHEDAEVELLFARIQQLILLSLLSVAESVINDPHCFELYGYDIIIDDNLKPWLIEVNASPSLSAETPDDRSMKMRVLDDLLHIVDMERRLFTPDMVENRRHPSLWHKPAHKQVGGFDLVCEDDEFLTPEALSHIESDCPLPLSTLGCANDRVQQLRNLKRHVAHIRATHGKTERSDRGQPGGGHRERRPRRDSAKSGSRSGAKDEL